jgi:hypothetical protein
MKILSQVEKKDFYKGNLPVPNSQIKFQALELEGIDLAAQGSESRGGEKKEEKPAKLSFKELFAEERS